MNNIGLPAAPWFHEGMTDLASMSLLERTRWKRDGEAQAYDLLAAGWMFEFPDADRDLDPWQWAWHRPPKRPGKDGRRFASTSQAWNAMRKEQA